MFFCIFAHTVFINYNYWGGQFNMFKNLFGFGDSQRNRKGRNNTAKIIRSENKRDKKQMDEELKKIRNKYKKKDRE